MNWNADTGRRCLKQCQRTAGCPGPGALCKRRGERCYQGTVVMQRSRDKQGFYIVQAVLSLDSRRMWLAGIKNKPWFFWNFWHREQSKFSTFPPCFFINVVITKFFSFDLLFYRSFSQHAVPLDLGIITNHILRIGPSACTPISSCL